MPNLKEIKYGLPKEMIPIPKPVPECIIKRENWLKEPTEDMSNENLITLILGG